MSDFIIDGRTKANFGEAAKQLTLSGTRTILLVSVGQRYHEGDKLRATVELINRSGFGQVTIAVADTLQRTNYLSLSHEDAYAKALQEGEDWLERNEKTLGGLTVPHDVLRWDEALSDADYPEFRARIEDAYANNPAYQQAVNATIGKFIDRLTARDPEADTDKAFRNCLAYLIEECPIIMPMWAHQGYDYVIYPQPMTTAMAETQRLFVTEEYPGKGGWLSLRFKKRAAVGQAAA
ncbi:tRNA-dependent cyclodipeptide synthase [Streptomyces sp. UNOC14_S4]|uniref:tRNA-dependent cyclodipeptide synthase n=1 Tax=Streptomyces sp. UNOC14_S4 TaxID=2872340 RepID=UPI001E59344A|nr:tRNA-dependent cyclodipeptide synthase [Streptomyces sp. UNOC14_S4]MCC3769353.1 tRNA-dependent cyclodipeptide synthase [Streptomyces sp. UNOC14_S4]